MIYYVGAYLQFNCQKDLFDFHTKNIGGNWIYIGQPLTSIAFPDPRHATRSIGYLYDAAAQVGAAGLVAPITQDFIAETKVYLYSDYRSEIERFKKHISQPDLRFGLIQLNWSELT